MRKIIAKLAAFSAFWMLLVLIIIIVSSSYLLNSVKNHQTTSSKAADITACDPSYKTSFSCSGRGVNECICDTIPVHDTYVGIDKTYGKYLVCCDDGSWHVSPSRGSTCTFNPLCGGEAPSVVPSAAVTDSASSEKPSASPDTAVATPNSDQYAVNTTLTGTELSLAKTAILSYYGSGGVDSFPVKKTVEQKAIVGANIQFMENKKTFPIDTTTKCSISIIGDGARELGASADFLCLSSSQISITLNKKYDVTVNFTGNDPKIIKSVLLSYYPSTSTSQTDTKIIEQKDTLTEGPVTLQGMYGGELSIDKSTQCVITIIDDKKAFLGKSSNFACIASSSQTLNVDLSCRPYKCPAACTDEFSGYSSQNTDGDVYKSLNGAWYSDNKCATDVVNQSQMLLGLADYCKCTLTKAQSDVKMSINTPASITIYNACPTAMRAVMWAPVVMMVSPLLTPATVTVVDIIVPPGQTTVKIDITKKATIPCFPGYMSVVKAAGTGGIKIIPVPNVECAAGANTTVIVGGPFICN